VPHAHFRGTSGFTGLGSQNRLRKIAQVPRSRSTPISATPGKTPQNTAAAPGEVCKIGPPSVCNLRPALTGRINSLFRCRDVAVGSASTHRAPGRTSEVTLPLA
jgi:hypothetical protein